jgi:hypothetical protein
MRIVEGVIGVVGAAADVVAQRGADAGGALSDEGQHGVFIEEQGIDIEARVGGGGLGAAVGA